MLYFNLTFIILLLLFFKQAKIEYIKHQKSLPLISRQPVLKNSATQTHKLLKELSYATPTRDLHLK